MIAATKQSMGLRWGRIVACTLVLSTAVAAIPASRLLERREAVAIANVSAIEEEEEDDFVLTPAFVAGNDLPILKAILGPSCEGNDGITLLSDKPMNQLDQRSGTSLNVLPAGLECRGMRIVADHDMKNATWNSLRKRFHGLSTLARVSLPAYSRNGTHARVLFRASGNCPLPGCSYGWEIVLQKIRGNWVVIRRTTTSMS